MNYDNENWHVVLIQVKRRIQPEPNIHTNHLLREQMWSQVWLQIGNPVRDVVWDMYEGPLYLS